MRTNFLNKVAAMSGKNVNELVGMSQNEVVNKVILPIIVQPTGQDIRGWRIGDDYMSLMAEFGEYCWQQDAFTGEILLEIALQRISCGAVLHEASSYKILPEAYRKYSAMCDQPGLMSDACFNFLQKQIVTCLKAKLTREHAKKIIFGLIDHLDEQGNELNGYMLKYGHFHTDTQTVFSWAWETAGKYFTYEELTILPPRNAGNVLFLSSKKTAPSSTSRISAKGSASAVSGTNAKFGKDWPETTSDKKGSESFSEPFLLMHRSYNKYGRIII